jgi:hypothetical protein
MFLNVKYKGEVKQDLSAHITKTNKSSEKHRCDEVSKKTSLSVAEKSEKNVVKKGDAADV